MRLDFLIKIYFLIVLLFPVFLFPNQSRTFANLRSNFQLALQHGGGGNFDKAINLLQEQIRQDPSFTEAYLRLVDFYKFNDNLAQGRASFQDAIKERSNNPNYYLGLALLSKYEKNWTAVFQHTKTALQKNSAEPETIELLVEAALQLRKTNELSRVLSRLRKRKKKNQLYYLGYAIWRYRIGKFTRGKKTIETFLNKEPENSFGYKLYGDIVRKLGDHKSSNDAYLKALQFTAAYQFHSNISILQNISMSYLNLSKPDSAELYLKQANQLAEKTGALDHQLSINRNYQVYYKELEMYHKLAKTCLEGMTIASKLDEYHLLPEFHYELANAYEKMADLERAQKHYLKTLAAAENLDDNNLRAKIYAALGRINFRLGALNLAKKYLQTSIDLAGATGNSELELAALTNLADVLKKEGKMHEAESTYKIIFKNAQKLKLNHFIEISLLKLSDLSLEINQERSAYYFNLAEAFSRQAFHRPFAANHRWMDGKLSLIDNDFGRAETLFKRAIELGRDTGSYFSVLAGYSGLIATYQNANFPERASAHCDSALDFIETAFNYCTQEPAWELFDLKNDLFAAAIQAYSNVGDLAKIYRSVELYKALNHYDNISQIKYLTSSSLVDSIQKKFYWTNKKIRDKWFHLRQLSKRDQGERLNFINSIKGEINQLHREQTNMLENYAETHVKHFRLFRPKAMSLNDLQQTLKQLQSVFIHYFVSKEATFLIGITPKSIFCNKINVKESYLGNLIDSLNPSLAQSNSQRGDLTSFRLDIAGELYKLLIEPASPWLRPGSPVIISPDGPLKKLPFEALVSNAAELLDVFEYQGAHFLVEDYPVSYVPFADFLKAEEMRRPLAEKKLLAFVGMFEQESKLKSVNGSLNRHRPWQNFSNTLAEEDYKIYTGGKGIKKRFSKEASDYQVLYFALPFIAQKKFPLYSKIYFSGTKGQGDFMQVHELFDSSLKAEVAILDNIENDSTQLSILDGFLHGLNFAGVPSLINSLWMNYDNPGSDLIIDFYENMKSGRKKTVALQNAKLNYLNTHDRNPYYWASYVLYGDPRPINSSARQSNLVFKLTMIAFSGLSIVVAFQFVRLRKEKNLQFKLRLPG